MRVRMLTYISGGRHDGREWPEANVMIDVPDWEAEDLIRAGVAVRGEPSGQAPPQRPAEPDPPEPAPGPPRPEPAMPPETATGIVPGGVAAGGAQPAEAPVGDWQADIPGEPAVLVAEPSVAAAEAPAVAPGPSAAKAAWIEFAVSQGADKDQAAAMTKADLMSRYGGRL